MKRICPVSASSFPFFFITLQPKSKLTDEKSRRKHTIEPRGSVAKLQQVPQYGRYAGVPEPCQKQ
jgi:hypothetical protein